MEETTSTYTDFSNSSPFEILGASFEKLFTQLFSNHSKYHHHTFEYQNNIELTIEYFDEMESNTSSSLSLLHPIANEFDEIHPITLYYGLRKFLFISSNENFKDLDESDSRFILSSLFLTLCQMKVYIPCFISIGPPSQNLYIGRFQTPKEMINFKSEVTKEIPSNLTNLDGLIDLLIAGIERKTFSLLISSRYHY
jgi:hypothetical protein